MAFSKGLVGWMAACALSAAQAGTLPNANTGTGAGASGSLAHAERFDYADSNLPQVAADLNEQILRIPADASGAVTLEATLFAERRPVPARRLQPRQEHRRSPSAAARAGRSRSRANSCAAAMVIAPNRQGFAAWTARTSRKAATSARTASRRQPTSTRRCATCRTSRTSMRRASSSPARRTAASYRSRTAPKPHRACAASSTSPAGCGPLRRLAENLVDAFDQYGAHTAVRSLWLYGDNDSVWTPPSRKCTTRTFRMARRPGSSISAATRTTRTG